MRNAHWDNRGGSRGSNRESIPDSTADDSTTKDTKNTKVTKEDKDGSPGRQGAENGSRDVDPASQRSRRGIL
jgi:hypothetical protein